MTETTKYYCVAMKVEKFVDEGPGEESFDMVPITNERYKLCCFKENIYANGYKKKEKFIIELHTSYGWCGSGYCGASFGNLNVESVHDFGPITHRPKDGKIEITGLDDYLDDRNIGFVDTNIFAYSVAGDDRGGDFYYPYGYVNVNMDLFEELPRAMKKRPVWVFYGNSGLGKSSLGYYLTSNCTVYETDSSENLPEEIWADIIVIGNKWGHTIENVTDRIAEKDTCKIIPVLFLGEKE